MGASIRPDSDLDSLIAARRKVASAPAPDPVDALIASRRQAAGASSAPRSTLYNAINNVDNALTGGVGQKFNAAFNAVGDKIRGKDSFTHSYNANLEAEHAGLEDFRAKHPIAGAVTGAVGGAAQVIAAAPLAAASELTTGATMGARALGAARTGFGLGAATAVGNAPNQGGIVENAGRALGGGLLGGTVGAVAVPLAEGAGAGLKMLNRGAGRVLSRAGAPGPTLLGSTPAVEQLAGAEAASPPITRSDRILLQRMDRAGLTPTDALSRLDQVPADKPISVMELAGDKSHPVRQLGKLVTRTQSQGAAELRSAVAERAEPLMSAKRVLGDVSEAMGVQRTNLVDHGQQLDGQRLAAAQPHYAAAEQAGPVPLDMAAEEDGPTLRSLLKRPSLKNAVTHHNEVALERGEEPLSLVGADGKELDALPLKTLQHLKFKLDDALGFAKTRGQLPDGTPATKAKLDAINETRLNLLAIMGKHSPDFAKGNEEWAGVSALKNAGDEGRDFISRPIDELQSTVGNMTPGESEQHNTTALSGPIRDRIFKTNAVDRAKLLKSPDMQERLDVVVPASRRPALTRNVGHEHEMAVTHQQIQGGSDTYENATNHLDAGQSAAQEGATALLLHGPRRAAGELLKKAIESSFAARLQGINEQTANELAPKLAAGMRTRADAQQMLNDLAFKKALMEQMRGSPPLVGASAGVTAGRAIPNRP